MHKLERVDFFGGKIGGGNLEGKREKIKKKPLLNLIRAAKILGNKSIKGSKPEFDLSELPQKLTK